MPLVIGGHDKPIRIQVLFRANEEVDGFRKLCILVLKECYDVLKQISASDGCIFNDSNVHHAFLNSVCIPCPFHNSVQLDDLFLRLHHPFCESSLSSRIRHVRHTGGLVSEPYYSSLSINTNVSANSDNSAYMDCIILDSISPSGTCT
jgi:hypothetical protein